MESPAILRTISPLIVGAIGAFVLNYAGVEIDTAVLAPIVGALYYFIARTAGERWPLIEKLMLWSDAQPMYVYEGEVGVVYNEEDVVDEELTDEDSSV